MKWDAVFFDFDGVIADSVDVKTYAFAELFKEYGPEIKDKVIEYHIQNGGMARYEKFRYYYKNLLRKDITDNELKKLGKRFSELVVEKVISSKYINGAIETLKNLFKNKIPLFIISGTPQDEIEYIVKKRSLSDYFTEVHGSPRKKAAIIKEILDRHKYHPSKCLFIGDSMSDYNAAKETGTQFIGIISSEVFNPFPETTKISIGRVSI